MKKIETLLPHVILYLTPLKKITLFMDKYSQ